MRRAEQPQVHNLSKGVSMATFLHRSGCNPQTQAFYSCEGTSVGSVRAERKAEGKPRTWRATGSSEVSNPISFSRPHTCHGEGNQLDIHFSPAASVKQHPKSLPQGRILLCGSVSHLHLYASYMFQQLVKSCQGSHMFPQVDQ